MSVIQTAAASTRRNASPPERTDIVDRDDIGELLRDFYGRAFRDDLLGPVFVDIARMDLDAHLPVMCDFWDTVLFHAGTYRRNALHPHQRLHVRANLTAAHFERWLALWHDTVDDRHAGPKAELAKLQATRIAGAMCRRIIHAEAGLVGGDREERREATSVARIATPRRLRARTEAQPRPERR